MIWVDDSTCHLWWREDLDGLQCGDGIGSLKRMRYHNENIETSDLWFGMQKGGLLWQES